MLLVLLILSAILLVGLSVTPREGSGLGEPEAGPANGAMEPGKNRGDSEIINVARQSSDAEAIQVIDKTIHRLLNSDSGSERRVRWHIDEGMQIDAIEQQDRSQQKVRGWQQDESLDRFFYR